MNVNQENRDEPITASNNEVPIPSNNSLSSCNDRSSLQKLTTYEDEDENDNYMELPSRMDTGAFRSTVPQRRGSLNPELLMMSKPGRNSDPSKETSGAIKPRGRRRQSEVCKDAIIGTISSTRRQSEACRDALFGKISSLVRPTKRPTSSSTTKNSSSAASKSLDWEVIDLLDSLKRFNPTRHQRTILGDFEALHQRFRPPQPLSTDKIRILEHEASEVDSIKSCESHEIDFENSFEESVRILISRVRHYSKKCLKIKKSIQTLGQSSSSVLEPSGVCTERLINTSIEQLVIDLSKSQESEVTGASPNKSPRSPSTRSPRFNLLSRGPTGRRSRGASPSPDSEGEDIGDLHQGAGTGSVARSFYPSNIINLIRRKTRAPLCEDEDLEMINEARWRIIDFAFKYGGIHLYYLSQAINMFFPLLKYGRRGEPHPTRLYCTVEGQIQWQQKRGGLSQCVLITKVVNILEGRLTSVFDRFGGDETSSASFSLVFQSRTLDLETQSTAHRDWLVTALRTLLLRVDPQGKKLLGEKNETEACLESKEQKREHNETTPNATSPRTHGLPMAA